MIISEWEVVSVFILSWSRKSQWRCSDSWLFFLLLRWIRDILRALILIFTPVHIVASKLRKWKWTLWSKESGHTHWETKRGKLRLLQLHNKKLKVFCRRLVNTLKTHLNNDCSSNSYNHKQGVWMCCGDWSCVVFSDAYCGLKTALYVINEQANRCGAIGKKRSLSAVKTLVFPLSLGMMLLLLCFGLSLLAAVQSGAVKNCHPGCRCEVESFGLFDSFSLTRVDCHGLGPTTNMPIPIPLDTAHLDLSSNSMGPLSDTMLAGPGYTTLVSLDLSSNLITKVGTDSKRKVFIQCFKDETDGCVLFQTVRYFPSKMVETKTEIKSVCFCSKNQSFEIETFSLCLLSKKYF